MIRRMIAGVDRRRLLLLTGALSTVSIWFAVRWSYRIGFYFEDAPGYANEAIQILQGIWTPRSFVNGLNIGTYAPVAPMLALFGKNETSLIVWPMICSFLTLASIAGITGLLLGPAFGVIAAFLFATYPADIFLSTVVMPDAIQTGFFTLSVYLAVRNRWTLAGTVLGVAHLVRANAVTFIPAALAPLILVHAPKGLKVRQVSRFAAGAISVIVLEGLLHLFTVGDFLHRFHAVSSHYGERNPLQRWGLNTATDYLPKVLLPVWNWWTGVGPWGALDQAQALHGIAFLLALVAWSGLLVALLAQRVSRKDPDPRLFLFGTIWLAVPILYQQFGSQSLKEYIPVHRLSRHFTLFAPAAIFLICLALKFVWTLLAKHPKRRLAAFSSVLALILGAHLVFAYQGNLITYRRLEERKVMDHRLIALLKTYSGVIFTDPGQYFLDFMLNPLWRHESRKIELHDLFLVKSCAELRKSVVVTDAEWGWREPINAEVKKLKKRLPCIDSPPKDWELLPMEGPAKVYLVR